MKGRPLLLAFASATVLAILASATWYDQAHLSMSECLDQEAKGYPHLEQVAEEVLGPVGDQIRRGSFCEEPVEPGGYVLISVYDWTSRKDARAYFREAGIALPHGESALTYQGVRITYATSVDHRQNDGQRYVRVLLSVSQ